MTRVRCTHCSGTYDLLDVEVIARYADCSVFKTPCCNRQADDRAWKSLPDFRKLTGDGDGYEIRKDGMVLTPDGKIIFR